MMELSCESTRYPEERRPKTSKYVELHVLHVPVDQWNVKLNKVPAEAIGCFISAGFIRVYPDITLKTLRSELVALLGMDRRIDKFSFLKCVGRSLALVKDEQERDLKVKTFAPPYAPQPELYLLSVVEVDGTVSSQSLSQDTNRSSPEQHIYFPHKTCSLPTETKEPVKLPMIPHVSHCPPPTQPSPEEEADNSYRSTAEEEVDNVDWGCHQPRSPDQRRHVSQVKGVNQTQVRPAAKGDTSIRKKQCYSQGRTARDSGVPESLEDRTSGFSLSLDRLRNSKVTQTLKISRNDKVLENSVMSSRSIQCSSPPRGSNVSPAMNKTDASPVVQTNGHHIFEEIRLVKEERTQLEWTRQELLRKGKDLLAQTRHRRNQARDSWKKKYFEAKKATAPLEYNLQNLRQELETFYNKLLHQLQARDYRRKQHQGRSNKNELIIQIMTQSHEIDNLRRQVEDAKMKLVTEIKLRRQAATELRALKAELAQKKSQTSHSGPITSLSFGATTQPRLPLGQHPP